MNDSDLKQFKEIMRIFTEAVEKAIEENEKAGITEDDLYASEM